MVILVCSIQRVCFKICWLAGWLFILAICLFWLVAYFNWLNLIEKLHRVTEYFMVQLWSRKHLGMMIFDWISIECNMDWILWTKETGYCFVSFVFILYFCCLVLTNLKNRLFHKKGKALLAKRLKWVYNLS